MRRRHPVRLGRRPGRGEDRQRPRAVGVAARAEHAPRRRRRKRVERVDHHDDIAAGLDRALRALHGQVGHLRLLVERAVEAAAGHFRAQVTPVGELLRAYACEHDDDLQLGVTVAQDLGGLAQQVGRAGTGRTADRDT